MTCAGCGGASRSGLCCPCSCHDITAGRYRIVREHDELWCVQVADGGKIEWRTWGVYESYPAARAGLERLWHDVDSIGGV